MGLFHPIETRLRTVAAKLDMAETSKKIVDKKKFLLAAICLIIVQCCFGGYAVVCQFFKKDMPNAVIFSCFRDSVAFPILLAWAHFSEGIVYPSKGDLLMLSLFGLLGMYGNQVLFILGLYNAGADSASLFQPTIPVFTSLFALIFCIEKPPQLSCNNASDSRIVYAGWLKTIGILAVTAGGFIIYFGNKKSGSASSSAAANNKVFGEILLVGNCVCCSLYVLLQKKMVFSKEAVDTYLAGKWAHRPINLTAWTYLFGAIFMFLHALIITIINPKEIEINAGMIYPLLYAAFLSSAAAYGLISFANSILPASMVTAFWPLQVPVAVVLNYYATGAEISGTEIFGGCVIIASLLFVSYSDRLMEKVKLDNNNAKLLGNSYGSYQAVEQQNEGGALA